MHFPIIKTFLFSFRGYKHMHLGSFTLFHFQKISVTQIWNAQAKLEDPVSTTDFCQKV